jgi:hypothetical protein
VRKLLAEVFVLMCAVFVFSADGHTQLMAVNAEPEMSAAALIEVPSQPIAKPTHKFFDRQNISLTAMTLSAALADGITTQHALGLRRVTTAFQNGAATTTTTRYVERNPVAAPLVNRGWAGQLAATALTTGADLAVTNWLHRRGHHRMERVIPFMFAATSASFAAHNVRYW